MENLLGKPANRTSGFGQLVFLLVLVQCCTLVLTVGDENCTTVEEDNGRRVVRAAPVNRNCRLPIGQAVKPRPKPTASDDDVMPKRVPRQLSSEVDAGSSAMIYGPYGRYFRRPIRFKRRRILRKLGLGSNAFGYTDD